MSWLIIPAGTFIVLYGLAIYLWHKRVRWRLNDRLSGWIKSSHYILTALTVTSIVLMITQDISFSGLWTTRIILIGFLVSGTIVYPLSNWAEKSKVEKLYFRIFSFLPLLVAAFSLIPFLGVVLLLSLYGQLTEPAKDIFYEDNKLRVQSTFVGVLGPPRLDIFQKHGLFEARINKLYRSGADIDSIRVHTHPDETVVIIYNERYDDDDRLAADTIRFKTSK